MKIVSLILVTFLFIHGCGKDAEDPNGFNREDYKIEADEMPAPVGGITAIQEKVVYPEDAKDEEIEGTVLVKTFINENGDVVWAEVLKSSNPVLDSAALSAAKEVKFTPGKLKGKNIKVQIVVPISFKLN
ncbi:MAG: energy transducer TonB [Ignavibacteria bacterium]|nr:energy transducer TonB [Ignavibacteria bacterium]